MSSPAGSPPLPSSSRSSPSSGSWNSDESLEELSFDYELDADGRLVRVSKGSSKSPHSTPPTPPKTSELPAAQSASVPARRSSLSRSESMPGGSNQVSVAETLLAPARQPTRASSGPVSMMTPAQPSRALGAAPLSGGLHGTGRKLGGAQRIRREEAERQRREIEERIRREEEEAERERARRALEEKENERVETRQSPPQSSRPIAALPSRQNYHGGFPRTARSAAGAQKVPSVSKINEHETNENEVEDANNQDQQQQPYQRRTALDTNGDPQSYPSTSRSLPSLQSSLAARPTSAYGLPIRARRVTAEERMRQEQEIAEEEALAEAAELQPRHSPSPPHVSIQNNYSQPRARQGIHQRRDSDTLRSGVPFPQHTRYEDTGVDQHPRLSPSSRSLGGTTAVQSNVRTNRSPPAPERPKSVAGEYAEQNANVSGKSHASSQRAQQQQQQLAAVNLTGTRNLLVNKKQYARLDMIGKGGSSRVYRVMNNQNEIYAIKRVSLDKTDDETIAGYMNEISLLRRLEGNRRVIRLIDDELKGVVGGSKGHLLLVMECGEIDLARLLQEQQKEPMNMVWIAYYWQQILEAVQVIHDEKIVHSDLKPANFVLVKGQLKLIDFGIAKAIANDTTNIQRDHQIGTVNYMSPEAIEIPEGMRRLKVGRPSDVWSLGCILYQMVYGYPPFHALTVFQKMKAIPDKNHIIEFPEMSVPSIPAPRNASNNGTPSPPKQLTHLARPVRRDVIHTMQACLLRDAKQRATIPELLDDDWLAMKEPIAPPAPPTPPPPPPALKDNETIINPFYMRQLLAHAFRVASHGEIWSPERQEKEADKLVQELKAISSGHFVD